MAASNAQAHTLGTPAGFVATLQLQNNEMNIDGKRIRISPGMNITAEIKTGQRTLMEYLLSPIERAVSEGMRER
jgi:hemolysin D